ncbi:MAG: LysR family transcriptional regulator [Kangiellaceae bacterium]|jgi:LysR family transcriptional regulator, glycine cleavage system transcriptional activator
MPTLAPIRGLRSFCVAAQCLSFKKAAEQLYLTPSAISHQVKQLEQQLGVNLFKRQTRAIELTLTGQQFYKTVRPILSELEQAITDFSKSQEKATLSISMPEFFASEYFVTKLPEWSEQHQDINLQLETVKSSQATSKPCDLSVVLANGMPASSVVDELFSLNYVPACNRATYKIWCDKGYQALDSVPLILHQARPWAWHQWADRALIDNFEPVQLIQLDSMFSVVRAAQKGMGIALIPMPISQSWFDDELLFRIFPDNLETNDRYFLVQNDTAIQNPALESFSGWVKQTFSTNEKTV